MSKAEKKAKNATPLGTHLLAGGTAGLMEALVCHPLDTIKVRMQLSKSGRGAKGVGASKLLHIHTCIMSILNQMLWMIWQVKARGFLATGAMIVKKESPLGLYKGVSIAGGGQQDKYIAAPEQSNWSHPQMLWLHLSGLILTMLSIHCLNLLRSKQASAPSWPALYPRWLFVLPLSRDTRHGSLQSEAALRVLVSLLVSRCSHSLFSCYIYHTPGLLWNWPTFSFDFPFSLGVSCRSPSVLRNHIPAIP